MDNYLMYDNIFIEDHLPKSDTSQCKHIEEVSNFLYLIQLTTFNLIGVKLATMGDTYGTYQFNNI